MTRFFALNNTLINYLTFKSRVLLQKCYIFGGTSKEGPHLTNTHNKVLMYSLGWTKEYLNSAVLQLTLLLHFCSSNRRVTFELSALIN